MRKPRRWWWRRPQENSVPTENQAAAEGRAAEGSAAASARHRPPHPAPPRRSPRRVQRLRPQPRRLGRHRRRLRPQPRHPDPLRLQRRLRSAPLRRRHSPRTLRRPRPHHRIPCPRRRPAAATPPAAPKPPAAPNAAPARAAAAEGRATGRCTACRRPRERNACADGQPPHGPAPAPHAAPATPNAAPGSRAERCTGRDTERSSRRAARSRRTDRAAARAPAAPLRTSSRRRRSPRRFRPCRAPAAGPDADRSGRGGTGTAPHGRFPRRAAGNPGRRPHRLHRTRPRHRASIPAASRSFATTKMDRFRFGARDIQTQQVGGETRTIVIRPDGIADHHRGRPRRPVAAPDSPGSAGPRDHHHRQQLSRSPRGRRLLCRPAAAGDPHSLRSLHRRCRRRAART